MNKPLKLMTVDELHAEVEYWDKKIDDAEHWGAAIAVAHDFRKAARMELLRREDRCVGCGE
jgi:hypothetical protein